MKREIYKKLAVLSITAVITALGILPGHNFASASDIVAIDGSSTVFPITEAVAEEFGKEDRSIRVTVGISGSGGGFKKFCRGETDISDASRPIKAKEIKLCKKNGIEFIEIPVAYDGLAVVVNSKNTWANQISVSELKKLWQPEAQKKITKWNQIRSEWPNKKISLFGPGVDSGTFDYFTEAIVGKSQASRGDFTSSEDDNVLVQGVATNKYALGYFGLAYYRENKDRLNVVSIDNGSKKAVSPSPETVGNGTYTPLSRPLFIYVAAKSLKRQEVKKFVNYYLLYSPELAAEVGYIALPADITTLVKKKYRNRLTGSVYEGKPSVGKSLKDLLKNK